MRRMLFFDGRSARRAWPVLGEYIRPNVNPRKSNSPSGTLQMRVFSALTVSFSLPMSSCIQLSGKRLLALWNALPGVEKRKKVGDRDALVDQLWSAIEMLPEPEPPSDAKPPSKQGEVIAMLRRPEGATVDEVASAMGWQRHTVRGLFSGTLKKKLGLTLASAQEERGRVYRITEPASA